MLEAPLVGFDRADSAELKVVPPRSERFESLDSPVILRFGRFSLKGSAWKLRWIRDQIAQRDLGAGLGHSEILPEWAPSAEPLGYAAILDMIFIPQEI
jgi:hypothetical protein